LQRLVRRGLEATGAAWDPLRLVYGWVHEAAALLGNPERQPAAAVRARYEALLATMDAGRDDLGALAPAVDHFLKVTASYRPGLFHCYDVADLPRTNNDLEHFFGAARYHERRATGRKQACPTTVVRGQVRLVASAATRQHHFCPDDLRPSNPAAWRRLRQALDQRHAARRAQLRFRRNPDAYLATLEARLLKPALPS
jgi:hypothetical protein